MSRHPFAVLKAHNRVVERMRPDGHGIRWRGVALSAADLMIAKQELYREGKIFAGPWRRYELHAVLDRALRNRVIK